MTQALNIADPIRAGLAAGWQVDPPIAQGKLEVDVVIVGTGAGGGITAEILTLAGLKVALIEEGPLKSSADFRMRESEAYPELYQDSAARQTADKGINILQGRCVGGSTTVNWTSSFRTPAATLAFWRERWGLSGLTPEALAPWFERAERRLGIGPWQTAPNPNNLALKQGADKIGIASGAIKRNVRGCWNLGYCGMGCPTNAKQSMLVTTLPMALQGGAILLTRTKAHRLVFEPASAGGGKQQVAKLICERVGPRHGNSADSQAAQADIGSTIEIKARHYVLSGGAINTPALLMRSQAPDPSGLLGQRTFLHPTVISSAMMPQRIDGHSGAPQTIYSDHFLETQAIDGPIGFKLEAPPLHPVLVATTLHGYGAQHRELMKAFPQTHVLIALMRDGFATESQGGKVTLNKEGNPVLDYPVTPFVLDGARRALLAMAEIQFAAGAQQVMPVHEHGRPVSSWQDAKKLINDLPMEPLLTKVVSAHVMGGCSMAADAAKGTVNDLGEHHAVSNLSVHDGSVFPTSLGVNPQLTIYGVVSRMASHLAGRLTGKSADALVWPAPQTMVYGGQGEPKALADVTS